MIEIGRLEDFPERSVRIVSVGRTEVGVVRWDGEAVYALLNICPHECGPLCLGRLGPKVVAPSSDPMAIDIDETCPVLACAWHGWEFDVRTGRALYEGSRYRVKTYPVTVEQGKILVDLGRKRAR